MTLPVGLYLFAQELLGKPFQGFCVSTLPLSGCVEESITVLLVKPSQNQYLESRECHRVECSLGSLEQQLCQSYRMQIFVKAVSDQYMTRIPDSRDCKGILL